MDKFDDENDLSKLEFNTEPIDGQIGVDELFIRESETETNDDEVQMRKYIPPHENQISFEQAMIDNKNENLNEKSLYKVATEKKQTKTIKTQTKINTKQVVKQAKQKAPKSSNVFQEQIDVIGNEEFKYKTNVQSLTKGNNFENEVFTDNNFDISKNKSFESSSDSFNIKTDRDNENDENKSYKRSTADDFNDDYYNVYEEESNLAADKKRDFEDDLNINTGHLNEDDSDALKKFFEQPDSEDGDVLSVSEHEGIKNTQGNLEDYIFGKGSKINLKNDSKKNNQTKENKISPQDNLNENVFENEDNVGVIKDVDEINKNFEEVNLTVGKDAFSGYGLSDSEKGNINIEDKVYNENSGEDVVDGMLYKNLDTVLHESMIPYSEHVILDRALPRVEDGLKPVQRRILYSMLELGVTPDKPYRKSARIVGDCLGKYHPHGDSSVYDAMVRMAQPFNTNGLLVSGHGNFGSVDGDGAAAMRYTEARLAPLAMELLRDLDKNTVKWALNFDDTLKEPEILPGRFPNILVNGTSGIAVGLATNIPPHNLAEVIDGVVAYIDSPTITLKEMLKVIKGPDFPTGATILDSSELYQAYETGRGKIYLRAKMHLEMVGDRKSIVITEFPYQVNKANLLQRIISLKEEGKPGFEDIQEVRDESDRQGIRAVVRLKKDANVTAVYNGLLKNTELQTTFGINMVAIANAKPKQMGLMDIISYYTEYQREVILRRSKYEYEQAKEREHILTGLVIAIKNIDAVVKIIKTSQNTTEAKKRLKEKFILSDKQAQAILDMRLARLTSLEVNKLEEELKKLRELIKKLTEIINSKKMQMNIVKEEILQIKRQYRTERKTHFAKAETKINVGSSEPEVAVHRVIILKNAEGKFKCIGQKHYNYAQKEANDASTTFDTHTLKLEIDTSKTLIAFSNLGNCYKLPIKDFSESRFKDKGVDAGNLFKDMAKGEDIIAIFDANDAMGKDNLLFFTKQGLVKKTAFSEYNLLKRSFQAMKLKDDDMILSIQKEPSIKDYTILFVSNSGMILKATNEDIPLQGRISGGVKGINLGVKDFCVGVNVCQDEGEVLVVTDKGFAKRVIVSTIEKIARYRKGVKILSFAGENGTELIYSTLVTDEGTLIFIDSENVLHFKNTENIPIEARIGKGKTLTKLKKSVKVIRAYKLNN